MQTIHVIELKRSRQVCEFDDDTRLDPQVSRIEGRLPATQHTRVPVWTIREYEDLSLNIADVHVETIGEIVTNQAAA